jgi:3-dehydroquinate synthase
MSSHRTDPPATPQTRASSTVTQRVSVSFEYPVVFTRNALHPRNDALADALRRMPCPGKARALACVDRGLAEARPLLVGQLREYFHARGDALELAGPPLLVPGGEEAKNAWDSVREILWTAGNCHLDRHSAVLAVGGGSVLDMVGFAASILHRGVRLVRMPSTTLAQNDAGVGIKNGMNEHGQKNFVGTFAPPEAVINDVELLTSLTDRDWRGGLAEAFKVAIIKDAGFFASLAEHAQAMRRRDLDAVARAVRRCAELHLEHIRTSGDPFETGSARPLDFGHWSAHKLELLSGHRLGHGQAVSIGMALDTCYAESRGLVSPDERQAVLRGLIETGLPVFDPLLDVRDPLGRRAVLAGLEDFREHLGGQLTVTLPRSIGRRVEVHHVDAGDVDRAVDRLRRLAREA